MYAIVDCNAFYVSCERLFNPKLANQPVIVLSNNDGVVVSLSEEAKALGLKRGSVLHEIKDIVDKHNVAVFSSNYTLYGDISSRTMSVLSKYAPEYEVYSIDEIFLNLSGMNIDYRNYGLEIIKTVRRNIGIPTSAGIAPTKTLAKLANRFSKKYKGYKNVCVIDTEEKRIKALQLAKVEDVWGIGRRIASKLNEAGVITAYDFTQKPRSWVRKYYTVTGERTWLELQGTPCIELDMIPQDNKQICTSKSFGDAQTSLDSISEAVATYASICAQKLRKQKSYAASIMVFVHTNNFNKTQPQYWKNQVRHLPVATNYTPKLVKHALEMLQEIFVEGYKYKKAGVIITEITKNIQTHVFETEDLEKQKRLSKVVDGLNHGYTKNLLTTAAQGISQSYKMKQNHKSRCYTTDIKDIIVVNCKKQK